MLNFGTRGKCSKVMFTFFGFPPNLYLSNTLFKTSVSLFYPSIQENGIIRATPISLIMRMHSTFYYHCLSFLRHFTLGFTQASSRVVGMGDADEF